MKEETIRKHILQIIARHSSKVVDLAQDILKNPETGFREFRTANLVHEYFDYLGLPHQDD